MKQWARRSATRFIFKEADPPPPHAVKKKQPPEQPPPPPPAGRNFSPFCNKRNKSIKFMFLVFLAGPCMVRHFPRFFFFPFSSPLGVEGDQKTKKKKPQILPLPIIIIGFIVGVITQNPPTTRSTRFHHHHCHRHCRIVHRKIRRRGDPSLPARPEGRPAGVDRRRGDFARHLPPLPRQEPERVAAASTLLLQSCWFHKQKTHEHDDRRKSHLEHDYQPARSVEEIHQSRCRHGRL